MITILVDENSKDGREIIESLRTKKSVTILDGESDWWDTISSKEKTAIEEGLQDIREGRIISHEEVMKKYEKWL